MQHYKASITDVFQKDFRMYDVAEGQIGKPPIFTKRNPPLLNLCYEKNILR